MDAGCDAAQLCIVLARRARRHQSTNARDGTRERQYVVEALPQGQQEKGRAELLEDHAFRRWREEDRLDYDQRSGSVTPHEIQWRLLRAERRALDGPQFKSPAVDLARTLGRMRALLIAQRAPKRRKAIPRIYSYAIEHCEKRIKELLPSVSIVELSKALTHLEHADFTCRQEQVINACWAIFERTHNEPESGPALLREINAVLKERFGNKGMEKCAFSLATVYNVLNRLDVPTKRGKRGPERGTRHKKTSKKRP